MPFWIEIHCLVLVCLDLGSGLDPTAEYISVPSSKRSERLFDLLRVALLLLVRLSIDIKTKLTWVDR